MKLAVIFFFLCLCLIGSVSAQSNITGAEYFIDNDPGAGNGAPISITVGTTIDIINLNIPTTSVSIGWHTLFVRTKNASNVWGLYEARNIYVRSPTVAEPPPAPITTMEYFFDNLTGPGTGQPITVTSGTAVDIPSINLANSLTLGWHTLHVRSQNQNNVWGLYETRSVFVRPSAAVVDPPPSPIAVMEYFYDNVTEPGTGQSITVTTGTTVNVPNVNLNNSLTQGWHTLHVRTKNQNNVWGLYESRSVFVRPITAAAAPPSPITLMEYFYDNVTDPGTGQSISITNGTAVNIPNTILASLSQGWHTLHVRTKNQDNAWGFYETRSIYSYNGISILPAPIVQFEYFIDVDPGVGLSTLNFSKPPATLIDLPAEPLSVSSLSLGSHNLGLRAKDQNGNWSPAELRTFTVSSPCGLSTPPNASNVTRCSPGTITLTANGATTGQTYRWFADNTTLVSLFTGNPFNTPSLNANTDYFVTVYDPATFCESARTQVSAIVTGIPKPSLNLTGSLTVCSGNSVTLIAPPGFAIYTWSNGLTTQQITVATSGVYTATVGDGTCTSPTSDPFTFTVNPQPSKPIINATGGGSLCGGGSVTLTAPAGFTTYSWSSGQSTQSIIVNAVGSFTVTVTDANGCQSIPSDVFTVTSSVPAKPIVTVTGNTTLCNSSTVTLNAPSGFGGYLWSTGATTQTIIVNAAGNYTVIVSNSSCNSPASDPVVVTSVVIPSKPVIQASGPVALCNGASVVLSAPNGFNSYLWSTGETTKLIVVSTAGSYTALVGNAGNCLSVASDPMVVSLTGINCVTGTQSPTAGNGSRCGAGTVLLNASGATGGQVYRWYDLPAAGTLLFTGPSFTTPSLTVSTPYYVSIFDSSTGESNRVVAVATIVNLAKPATNITGSISMCSGSSTLLSAPTGFTQYLWSNGAVTQQIQVTAAGNYSVQTGDGTCLSIPSDVVSVSIVNPPVKPGITIMGSTTLCGSGSVLLTAPLGFVGYSWSTGEVTQSITASSAGSYSVTVSNSTCTSVSSDAVTVNVTTVPTKPIIQTTGVTALCNSSFAVLTAPTGFNSYKWSTGEVTGQIVVSAAGNYSVQVGNALNCLSVSSDPVNITLTGLACTGTIPPLPPAITNATRCGTGSVVLKAGGASTGQVYRWFSNNTSTSILFTGASFTTPSLTTTASYFASIYDPTSTLESSRVTATATINNLPRPVLNLTGNQSTCVGTGLLLSAPVGYAQYLWSNGAVTQQLSVTVSGNYSVQTGDGVCLSSPSDVTNVSVIPQPSKPILTIVGNTTFCETGSVTLTGPAGFLYQWSNGAATQSITISDTNVLSLVVKTSTGCVSVSSDPVVITRQGPPCQPNFPPVITTQLISAKIEGVATADLTKFVSDPNGNLDYASIHFLSTTTAQGAHYLIDGNYIVTIDYKGLPFNGTDHITLSVCDLLGLCVQKILDIDVVGEIVVFNGVTPDGDGKNDFFRLQYLDVIPNAQKNKVTIFNRWGDIVFEIDNYNNIDRVFSGTGSNGHELPGGSYFYRIDLESSKPITGFITLKR